MARDWGKVVVDPILHMVSLPHFCVFGSIWCSKQLPTPENSAKGVEAAFGPAASPIVSWFWGLNAVARQ